MDEEIRKSGGTRPGSGRKKTGRRREPYSLSVTPQEKKAVAEFLKQFRAEHPDPPIEKKSSASFYITESEREAMQEFLNEIRKDEGNEDDIMAKRLARYRTEHPDPQAEEKIRTSFYVGEVQKSKLREFLKKIRTELKNP